MTILLVVLGHGIAHTILKFHILKGKMRVRERQLIYEVLNLFHPERLALILASKEVEGWFSFLENREFLDPFYSFCFLTKADNLSINVIFFITL